MPGTGVLLNREQGMMRTRGVEAVGTWLQSLEEMEKSPLPCVPLSVQILLPCLRLADLFHYLLLHSQLSAVTPCIPLLYSQETPSTQGPCIS